MPFISYENMRRICLKNKRERASTLRYNNLSPKKFKRFFIGDLCELLLEARHLDDLWFVTTQPQSNYLKLKRTFILQVIFT
jgi:hypothetical protein